MLLAPVRGGGGQPAVALPGHTALVLAEVGLSHALPHLTPGHHTSNLLRKKFKC